MRRISGGTTWATNRSPTWMSWGFSSEVVSYSGSMNVNCRQLAGGRVGEELVEYVRWNAARWLSVPSTPGTISQLGTFW